MNPKLLTVLFVAVAIVSVRSQEVDDFEDSDDQDVGLIRERRGVVGGGGGGAYAAAKGAKGKFCLCLTVQWHTDDICIFLRCWCRRCIQNWQGR